MNPDIILYTSQFLTLKDKMSIAQTCREMYSYSNYMYKDEIVKVNSNNIEWIKKYKPKLKINDLQHINLETFILLF